MSYPWPSFGAAFLFERSEQPLYGSDLGWNSQSPTIDRRRPLGSATDSIVTLAVGSAERTFEVYLTPTRARVLEALVTTTAVLTDWEKPDPDSRAAYLLSVVRLELLKSVCFDGVTLARWRCALHFISQ